MEQTAQRPHEQVAGEVRAALARQRISGRRAARELGWDANYIHRRLDGRTAFDVNDLVALAQLLDVPLTSFFPDVIMNGGGAPVGSNKQNYWTPAGGVETYPSRGFACCNGPKSAVIGLAA